MNHEGLLPLYTVKPPAPIQLLNIITCNCKTGCERNCGCKRAGTACSSLCGECHGTCCNSSTSLSDDDESNLDGQDDEIIDNMDTDINKEVLNKVYYMS